MKKNGVFRKVIHDLTAWPIEECTACRVHSWIGSKKMRKMAKCGRTSATTTHKTVYDP